MTEAALQPNALSTNVAGEQGGAGSGRSNESDERGAYDRESIPPSGNSEVDAQIRRLLETLPGMFSIASPDGQLEYFNQEFLELVGVPLAEMAGTGWVSRLHPDDEKGAVEEWVRRSAAELPFQYYYRVRVRDGTYRWCQWLVKPLFDKKGKLVKFYGYLSDVDTISYPDESLRDSEQALRLLVDSVPALVSRFTGGGSSFTSSTARGSSSSTASIKSRILDLSLLAAVALEQLQLISASRFAREALNRARANGMNETIAAGSAAVVLAHAQYELGDLDRAEQLTLGHLAAVRAGAAPNVVVQAYTILARIAQHRARFDQASAVLDEGKAVGEHRSSARTVLMMMAERVRLWISRHEIARAQQEFVAMERYMPNLDSPRRYVGDEIGQICDLTRWRLALAGGRALEAISPLRNLCHAARSAQHRYTEFALTLELSGALEMSGEHDSAERLLARALQRGERYGLFQCWLDASGACRDVLSRLASRAAHGANPKAIALNSYLASLLSHGVDGSPIRHHVRDGTPRETGHLSSRECAVLTLVAKGQSNKRVAQTLRITPETVKSHLKRTFVKLQSKTRAEAVARATELGFLASTMASTLSI